jgi:hypothetical protein
MAKVIGKIKFDQGEAILTENGWKCSADKDIEDILNLRYNPKYATGVAVVLPTGAYELSEAARFLGGKITYQEKYTPLPKGAVS